MNVNEWHLVRACAGMLVHHEVSPRLIVGALEETARASTSPTADSHLLTNPVLDDVMTDA